jgi:hypothetical protein
MTTLGMFIALIRRIVAMALLARLLRPGDAPRASLIAADNLQQEV